MEPVLSRHDAAPTNDQAPQQRSLATVWRAGGSPRVCFASTSDVQDHRAHSGTVHGIHRALRSAAMDLDILDRIAYRKLQLARLHMRLLRLPGGTGWHQVERTRRMAANIGQRIHRHLVRHPADVVFSNSTATLAGLPPGVPAVFFTDATFRSLRQLYPELADYPNALMEIGEELEHRAIHRATRLVYTSAWAARSAVQDYGADPERIVVIPRGGNLGPALDANTVQRAVALRSQTCCELLLVGVSWKRKGGAMAAEVLLRLHEAGIPARLTVVGCTPPPGTDRTHMEVHPFLNKGRERDLKQLLALFDRSHFLLVPSEAECFGIVYAEASSRGLPSLTRLTGGVEDAVRNDINGHVFPFEADASAYAEHIAGLWADRAAYESLALSSFAEYRTRLNWLVVGQQLRTVLEAAASEQVPSSDL
jgi:glycosyltransferase involved in cell wall biosynthesis